MNKQLFLFAALLGMLPSCCAQAEGVATNPVADDSIAMFANPSPELLHQIAAMVERGQYAQARSLLALSRMQRRPHLEVLFLSGLIYARQGDYRSAADEFRAMLARDAGLVRPRLELAYALFLNMDYEGAEYHFQQVLSGSLPEEVRSKVLGFLTAIREQLPSYNFSLEIVNDSNPRQSSSNQTVTLGGNTYRLNTTAPSQTIWGAVLSGGAYIPLSGPGSWFARANASLTDYPNADNDQLSVQFMMGKHVGFEANTLTFEAGGQHQEYRGLQLSDGLVWRIGDYWRQSDRSSWQAALQGGHQIYADYSYLNGWQYTLTLDNQFMQSASSRWQTGASLGRNLARESAYSFSSPSVYVRYVMEWDGGLITGVRWQKSSSAYFGDDPFFGMTRHDAEQRVEIDLVNRNWRIGELSPRLLIGSISHRSNIALYEFRRDYVRVGVSREF